MATTANTFPTAGANVDRAGSTAWTNPGNVVSDNATDATVVVPSDYLVTSGYGFAIPANTVICGVTVRVEAAETGTGTSTYIPQLHSATTPTLIGAAKSAVTVSGATPVISTNGGIGDLWGATLTPAIVNGSGFGVSIWSTDTINTILVDFITIAITWTDVPNAWSERQYFRKRRNSTNRRRLDAPLNAQTPGTPSNSVDRTLGVTFTTRLIPSRRALSIGWIAALAAYAQAPVAQPVSAWMARPVVRRRSTERRVLVVDHAVVERYTPATISWSDPPKVVRVEFRRTLQKAAPQLLFPPPTGPPGAYYPAWAARVLPATFQDRRLLKAPEHNVYPETPKPEPNLCARIPGGFHKRKVTERRLLTVELDSYPATPVPEISDDRTLEQAFVTRTIRSRRLQTVPPIPFAQPAAAPQAQPLPAWIALTAKRRSDAKRKQFVVALSSAPVTPLSTAPLTAWALKLAQYRPSHRTLRKVAELDSYPATPAQQAQPISAVAPQRKVKRRKHRQGLFLSGGGVVEARVQPQFPSYATQPTKKRASLERRLIRAPGLPSAPQTPGVGAQPVSAWAAPKQHWIDRARTLQKAAPQITYPATPAVAAQPESAWRAVAANRVEQQRKLLPQAAQITYPRTLVSDVATRLVKALKRRDTKRTLRVVAHADRYQQTPVPFQQPTSWKLATAFRRHGWRKWLEALELDVYPDTPEQSKPKPKKTKKLKEPNRTTRLKRPARTLVVSKPNRTEKP